MTASRIQQLIGRAGLVGALVIAGAAFTGRPGAARKDAAASAIVTIGDIASQLGVSIALGANDEFALGVQFTGVLQAPEKLDLLGIPGMHPGARVYAARIGPDRVQVEADELSPPKRATARLRLDESGKLLAATKPVAMLDR